MADESSSQRKQFSLRGRGMGHLSNSNSPMKGHAETKTRTLLVNGLPETEDYPSLLKHMFKLFCTMGNVKRIKILFKKRTSALIQFEESEYAKVAKMELNDAPFFSAKLHISLSKHDSITRFTEDMLDEVQKNLCQDFAADGKFKEYRFKGTNSKTYQVVSPSPVLHFANIPAEMSIEMLLAKIAEFPDLADCQVINQKLFSVQ